MFQIIKPVVGLLIEFCCVVFILGITVGTTTITSGTNGRIAYNNAGIYGEKAVTGTGDVVLATSPTLVTPDLGTPSALVGTNISGTISTRWKARVGSTTSSATPTIAQSVRPILAQGLDSLCFADQSGPFRQPRRTGSEPRTRCPITSTLRISASPSSVIEHGRPRGALGCLGISD